MSIKQYLEYFINNAENITKINKPYLYSYPHLTGEKNVLTYSSS